jgi:O6-methylguanine-DNA--protein-cysteine methyltransferase
MRRGAQRLPRAVRLGFGVVAIGLASALLAACASTDGWLLAEDSGPAVRKAPGKVTAAKSRQARADRQGPAASSITTASIGKAAAETVVDLPYRPAVGSRWIGTSETRQTKTKAGRAIESMTLRDRGEYRIIEKLEKGYRVSYTLHDGSIGGTTPLAELMKPLIQSMKGQSYAYETDDGGTPTRVIDLDRLKAVARKAVDLMAESKPEFTSVPQLKQFVDGMRSQFDAATPETGVDLFLEPVVRLSMVQGLTNVPLGEERSYDDLVTNPLTGAKMRARGSYKVAAVDKAKGLATIEWRLTVLPEDLSKATRDFVLQFMPEGADASKLDEAMAQMKLEHIDRATYRIALADGVVRRMDRTAVVKAHDMENKTVVTMTLSPAR